jgi:hypothetical protein
MRPQTRLNGASQAGLGPGGRERPHRGRAGRLRRGPLLFTLGDLDFATHILRTQLLAEGRPLSEVTRILCARRQPGVTLLPMSDDKIEIRARRLRRGELLRHAPLVIVPCLELSAAHAYPDERRRRAERDMFTVSMGAGVENLLVALAVENLGSDVAADALDLPDGWHPRGAVGHPAAPAPPRPPRDPAAFTLIR